MAEICSQMETLEEEISRVRESEQATRERAQVESELS
jgi:hypothetical protein